MKKQSIIVSFLFLICIYFFFISSFIVEDKSFSYNENRKLEQKPVLTLDTLLSGEFSEKYEKYVTDQVLFRDDFVKFSTNIKLLMGQKEVNGVYISDGFLVEKFKESDIDLDLLNKNKNDVKKFVEKYNAKFHEVKVRMLPERHEMVKKHAEEHGESTSAFINRAIDGKRLVFLRPRQISACPNC